MALVSEDLARTVENVLRIAGKYAGKEPPTSVTIPQDFTNRLLDGNQITAMLQLQMQNQISRPRSCAFSRKEKSFRLMWKLTMKLL